MISMGLIVNILMDQGLWAKAYRDTSDEEFTSIVRTQDGGYAVTGFSPSSLKLYEEVLK